MSKRYFVFIGLAFSCWTYIKGQQTFTPEAFLEQVAMYHPVAQQTLLFETQGQAQLRAARGQYDPYLNGKFDQKDYDQSRYWQTLDAGMNWQSPLAFSVQGGYQLNNGLFLNPEQTIPDQGQAYLDITLPLGKGLLMDAPRLAVKQAKIGQQDLVVARQEQLNTLLFVASERYWNWAAAVGYLEISDEARQQAQIRFQGIKESYLSGDRPGIDTVDAYVQWQSFELSYLEALLAVQKAEQDMLAFTWTETGQQTQLDGAPFALLDPDAILPGIATLDPYEVVARHPEYRRYTFKLANLQAERRYKQESLKPKLDVSYRALSAKTAFTESDMNTWWNPNDYKVKVSLGFPLFVREARGELALNDVKQEITTFDQTQKQADLVAKVRAAQAEVLAYYDQWVIGEQNVVRYRVLLDAEVEKFLLGESTLFVVNSRAQKLVSSQQKLISLRAKYEQARIKLLWASGILWQQYVAAAP